MLNKKYKHNTIIFFIFCFFSCLTLHSLAFSATPQNSGNTETLPGIEITPQQMQKYFPAPLKGDAKTIPLVPSIVPLTPISPQSKKNAPSSPVPIIPNLRQPKEENQPKQDFIPSIPQTHENFLDFSKPKTSILPAQRQTLSHPKHLPLTPTGNVESMGLPTPPSSVDNSQTQNTNQTLNTFGQSTTGLPKELPSLEIMLGQMIMAGFTGTVLESNAPILTLIKTGKVGGVFLQAIAHKDNTANAQTPNPHAPLAMQQGGQTSFQNSLLAQSINSMKIPLGQQGNILSPTQLRMLIASLQHAVPQNASPLFVAVEQEGGAVQSLRKDLGFEGLAAAAYLGQGSAEKTEIAARRAGLEMAGLGINFVLGPAGDVNVNPLSESIGQRFRSFGINEQLVAAHVLAFGKGLLATKVLPCIRNFPGTGSVVRGFLAAPTAFVTQEGTQNFMQSIPDMVGSWQERELFPYKQDINYAVQPALIYHRGLDALRPAPLSANILQTILRERLGFQGIILSQDLRTMQAFFSLEDSILQAIQAGTDILLITEPAASIANPSPLQGFGPLGESNIITEILGSGTTENNLASSEQLSKKLLQQSLGKVLPGAFQADVRATPTTGLANEATKVYDILLRLVKNGTISTERIVQSWQRIQQAKKQMEL